MDIATENQFIEVINRRDLSWTYDLCQNKFPIWFPLTRPSPAIPAAQGGEGTDGGTYFGTSPQHRATTNRVRRICSCSRWNGADDVISQLLTSETVDSISFSIDTDLNMPNSFCFLEFQEVLRQDPICVWLSHGGNS